MVTPSWWAERRFGILLHTTIACVPGWAPVGQYAEWYRSHLGDDLDTPPPGPHPMVEVLAHHRDRWGHIARYDDFAELLNFDEFDGDEWARLAVDAGAGFAMIVGRHHDGLYWWDAAGTRRSTVHLGPGRDVVGEFATACERNDVVFGAFHSCVDWSGAPDDPEACDARVDDLVERYGASVVWNGAPSGPTPPEPDAFVVHGPAGIASVRVFDHEPPAEVTTGPWVLSRSIGRSPAYNRNEGPHDHLDASAVVALLTEVVAKGGHLLLGLGPRADGTVPELQSEPLRRAGTWIRAHERLLAAAAPWQRWGDETVRYLCVDGALHVVDVAGTGVFRGIDATQHRVESVVRVEDDGDRPMHHVHEGDEVRLDLPRSSPWRRAALPLRNDVDVAVYRVELVEVDAPGALFAPADRARIDLAPLVAGARPGDIVQLGDGEYLGPVDVPPGVILRGLGPDRTSVVVADDRPATPALRLGRSSRIEHLRAHGVELAGQFTTMLGCAVDGRVDVRGTDALVRASKLGSLTAIDADRLTVSRCALTGGRWDVAIDIAGGSDHEVDSCEFDGHLCAVRATDTTGTVVRGNTIAARWWGVHLVRTERAHVHGNRVRSTMRAVDVDGGVSAVVDGNAVLDGDSGCIVEGGAAECRVAGNHWERCRIGLLAWDAAELHHQDNHVLALTDAESAFVSGP